MAADANVKKVLLVHLFPNCKGKEEIMIADVKKGFNGPVEIGCDMQRITL
jgi:ribonuclease BN (tRNA processing enzyme)